MKKGKVASWRELRRNMCLMKIFFAISAISPLTLSAAERGDTQIGVSLGTPGVANLVLKKEISGHPLQLAVGYVGSAYGAEAGYSFYYDSSSVMRSWQAIVGTFTAEDQFRSLETSANGYRWRYEDESWNYLGLSATFQYGGLFLEPGLSVGTGDFSSPQVTIQLGWLWSL